MRQSWETTASVSADHIILTSTHSMAATAEIEPGTSSPGVARSTDWATASLQLKLVEIWIRLWED